MLLSMSTEENAATITPQRSFISVEDGEAAIAEEETVAVRVRFCSLPFLYLSSCVFAFNFLILN